MTARFLVHDGLHRCEAIKQLARQDSRFADHSIPVVVYVDPGFRRSDQILSDLKQNERRTPSSLRVFCNERDEIAQLTRELISRVPLFVNAVETKRSTLSNRSRNLFTLSALYHANKVLLASHTKLTFEEKLSLTIEYWSEVAKRMHDWTTATVGNVSPAELRATFIHSHALALAAIARVGRTLLTRFPKTWKNKLSRLRNIDWRRENSSLWEGRAMIGGRISKSNSCVILTANAIKSHLGLPLSDEEEAIEQRFNARK